jgi:Holliday junction DNA helicase RuvA
MDLFKILTSVPRVGTRVALRILTALEPAEIVAAVENRTTSAFRAVSGVGEGLAERLVIDLKKKVRTVRITGAGGAPALPAGIEGQAREALKTLGYRPDEIRDALAWVRESNPGSLTLDDMVRRALGYFQKGT